MIPVALDAIALPLAVAGRGPAAMRRFAGAARRRAHAICCCSPTGRIEDLDPGGRPGAAPVPAGPGRSARPARPVDRRPARRRGRRAGRAGALGARAGQRRGPPRAVRLPQRRRGASRRPAADGVHRRRQPGPRGAHPRPARHRIRPGMGRARRAAARASARAWRRDGERCGGADRRAAAAPTGGWHDLRAGHRLAGRRGPR